MGSPAFRSHWFGILFAPWEWVMGSYAEMLFVGSTKSGRHHASSKTVVVPCSTDI